jgi:hypothetical protein
MRLVEALMRIWLTHLRQVLVLLAALPSTPAAQQPGLSDPASEASSAPSSLPSTPSCASSPVASTCPAPPGRSSAATGWRTRASPACEGRTVPETDERQWQGVGRWRSSSATQYQSRAYWPTFHPMLRVSLWAGGCAARLCGSLSSSSAMA